MSAPASLKSILFSIIAESVSLCGCMREFEKRRYGRSLIRWFRESRSSALIVIFGADVTALAGPVLALGAILTTLTTSNPTWDAISTSLIAALFIVIAFFIAVEVKAFLTGQRTDPKTLQQMRQFFPRSPRWSTCTAR